MKKENLIVLSLMIFLLTILSSMNHSEDVCNKFDSNYIADDTVKQMPAKELNKKDTLYKGSFNNFKEAIAFSESSGNYKAMNRYGYLGKYQFGKAALNDLGLKGVSTKHFLHNHKLQERAFIGLISINKYRLRNYYNYVGKTINGIKITESGMLAAAHLVGSNSVKDWIKSNGKKNKHDANGVTLEHYMNKFGGYNTSTINAKRTIRVKL